ncbi:MerR family transcriptional regulator [Arthrobacter frigidicola]|nr:MerR family transcriptional regulator [Arthrobacter frigidicola]
MKISQLSAASGVSQPTIKLYLREGLLPPGAKTHANQATYSEAHVRRLGIIRTLTQVGGLSVASAKTVLDAIDSDLPLNWTFGLAQRAASPDVDGTDLSDTDLARADDFLAGLTYHDGPGRFGVAKTLRAMAEAGLEADGAWRDSYRKAAEIIGEADIDLIDRREGRLAKAETVVIGTVLGDALLAALRRAAQEHFSSQRYPSRSTETAP